MEERDYWYWLGVTADLGGAAAGRLLALYGDAESVFREKELPIGGGQQAALEESRKKLDELLRERDAYEKAGIHWCHRMDACYPKRMRDIPDPPIILFWRGELPPEEEKTAAVIGARRCSAYGRSMAERFGSALAKEGVAVISGMAMGIDGYAQSAAVNAGGRSFAVLGCGVDQAYPAVNRPLYESLLTAGGVISEYKPGTPPLPYHFPRRNRIISGLSDALLLIEAALRSGTQSTVNHALDQGRMVFALPGNIDSPGSELPLKLLKEGAEMCTCPSDILSRLHVPERRTEEREALSASGPAPADHPVLRALRLEEKTFEELLSETGMDAGSLSGELSLLELDGKIEKRPGRAYALVRA